MILKLFIIFYEKCSFSWNWQISPNENSNLTIGKVSEYEAVKEEGIEVANKCHRNAVF